MIFEAFSESKVWILEKTILVASYESMGSNTEKPSTTVCAEREREMKMKRKEQSEAGPS